MTLIETATNILDMAAIGAASAVTILMRGGRPVEVTSSNDWALESLLHERGAEEAFRVRRLGAQVLVEGRSRTGSCRLTRTIAPRPAGFPATRLLNA